ncbi:hypothetical protein [Dyadobacter sp. 676]|uniref:Uncharacterized protein n=1 Tax=Dyadobacter sp. 676 TaxID=3088362 RepID=A0AAU8FIC4_9BACT
MDKMRISPALEKVQQLFRTHGQLRPQETGAAGQKPDMSVITHFICENAVILDETGTGQAQAKNWTANSYETATNRFLRILARLARANEGLSRQERIFVYQYWSNLQNTFQAE